MSMKSRFTKFFLLGGLLYLPLLFSAQTDPPRITLQEAIILAQEHSIAAAVANNRLVNSHWAHQSFLASLKPQLSFQANPFPLFNRSIDVITQPDGRDKFIQRSLMRSSFGIELEQYVGWTGGTVYAYSGLQRLDIMGENRQTSYFSVPLSFGFDQPLFSFDPISWKKRLEPIRMEESESLYSEEMEEIAFQTTEVFFDVLLAQLNLNAASSNRAVADTLYRIAQERFEYGKVSHTELLQLELQSKNQEVLASEAQMNLQAFSEELKYLLGSQHGFELEAPTSIPDLTVPTEKALTLARQNRSFAITHRRQLLEAEMDIEKAKKDRGIKMSVSGSFGLSQTSQNFAGAFSELLDQEQITIGLQVPIADWGKARADKEVALSNLNLVRTQNHQNRLRLEQDVLTSVQQIHLIREKIDLAQRSYEIAQIRSQIGRQRYAIGKIDIIELNIALEDEENSRIKYITSVKDFWVAYYHLRRLTLYDFIDQKLLVRSELPY